MADTIYKLQKRVEQYSTEASVYQEGDDRINIEIPGVSDANTILDAISTSFLSELKVILPDFLTIIIISLVYMVIANFTNDDKTVKNALYFDEYDFVKKNNILIKHYF